MSEYKAAEIEALAARDWIAWDIRQALTAYATLLREREKAREGVTDEIVERMAAAHWEASRAKLWSEIPSEIQRDEIAQMRAALEAAWPVQAQQGDSDHEFKNFHRQLCERFGYVHDDIDWRRDQVSLIEWIASKQAQQGEPVGEVFGPKAVSTMVALVKPLPPGTKLYTHAERPGVPSQCIWPDCGHNTNCSDPRPGCNGIGCPAGRSESAAGTNDLLAVALEANDMCRSAFQVAERVATQYATVYAGANFGALHEQLRASLDRQHKILSPYRHAMLAAAPEPSEGE